METTAEPSKKGPSGCTIVMIVLLVAGLLLVVGAGFSLYLFSKSPAGQAIIEVAGDAVRFDGREELLAAGCDLAVSMNMDALPSSRADAEARVDAEESPIGSRIILCQQQNTQNMPECDDLAGVYAGAASPTENFSLVVQTQEGVVCSGLYSRSGTFLNTVEGFEIDSED